VVREVLVIAGFEVEDLDATSGTRSADLLTSLGGRHWLVEVKSAAGSPNEGLVGDLDRHVRTWSNLERPEEIEGSILVVNHQHKLSPLDRDPQPYVRPEFVESLQHTVVPTLALFAWWRDRRHDRLRDALTGPPRCHTADLLRHPEPMAEAAEPLEPERPSTRPGWWQRRRG
jgi:hypothetical protein